MFKDTITYTDYDGNERKKELMFNLSKAEVIEIEMLTPGTITSRMEKVVDEFDIEGLMKLLKFLIVKSYGEKSADGNRFIKSQELVDNFLQTEAYTEFLMKLLGDHDYATNFMIGLLPALPDGVSIDDLKKQVENDPRLAKFKNDETLALPEQ